MKRLAMGMVLVYALTGVLQAAIDSGPLERHLARIEARVHSLGPTSYVKRAKDGTVVERYNVEVGSLSDFQYGPDGTLLQQWVLHPNGSLLYEAWYGPKLSKERLLEDDRTISYSSFYKNRQKWEMYTLNKEKGLRSYYVYDEQGHLLSSDI